MQRCADLSLSMCRTQLQFAAAWHLVGPVLAKRGYQVVAVDFAGHGRSSHRSLDAPYMPLHYVEDTMLLLVAMGESCGASLAPQSVSQPPPYATRLLSRHCHCLNPRI